MPEIGFIEAHRDDTSCNEFISVKTGRRGVDAEVKHFCRRDCVIA
jgi:hypothetical protein